MTGGATAGRWVFPGDGPVQIARKVAQAYRAALGVNNRELRDTLDRTMVELGQAWVIQPEVHDDTEPLTTEEAAAYVSVSAGTIRRWACTPHPATPGRMLLPRFGWRGPQRTYLAVHVVDAADLARQPRRPTSG